MSLCVRVGGYSYVWAHPVHALHTKDSMSNGMQRTDGGDGRCWRIMRGSLVLGVVFDYSGRFGCLRYALVVKGRDISNLRIVQRALVAYLDKNAKP